MNKAYDKMNAKELCNCLCAAKRKERKAHTAFSRADKIAQQKEAAWTRELGARVSLERRIQALMVKP